MARETRAATGNSKPRVFPTVDITVAKPKRTTKAKANTTAKRAPATKGAKPVGVTKKKAPATKKTTGTAIAKKPTLATKAKGVAEKVAGTIEGKPGKKAAGTRKLKGEQGTVKTKATAKKV